MIGMESTGSRTLQERSQESDANIMADDEVDDDDDDDDATQEEDEEEESIVDEMGDLDDSGDFVVD